MTKPCNTGNIIISTTRGLSGHVVRDTFQLFAIDQIDAPALRQPVLKTAPQKGFDSQT